MNESSLFDEDETSESFKAGDSNDWNDICI